MLCCCYFLSCSFIFFFNDRLEQRDLGNYKTDLHQIFRIVGHVGVECSVWYWFSIGQGMLPWQPILGAKSAEILGLASNNGWEMAKRMGALTAQKFCLHRIKFDELWSSNSGVYGDGLVTIYAPNARNRRNAFDSGDSHSTTDGRIAERICAKFTRKTCLFLRSDEFKCQDQRSKVKVTRDKKRAVHSQQPLGVDGMKRPRCI